MEKYLISIELESDTCFGAGESRNGLVNNEILFDENKLPYLLGKTFKGVLKNEVTNILVPSLDSDELEIVNALLGDKIINLSRDKNITIKWSNFNLDLEIVKILNINNELSKIKKKIIEKNEKINEKTKKKTKEEIKKIIKTMNSMFFENVVNESLMKIEESTKINDNKTAEVGSLRSIRLLRKGLIFNSIIESPESLDDKELELLKLCLNTITHLGINKTRGKGKVKICFEKISDDKKPFEITPNDEKNYVLYELFLEEPIKMGSSNSQYDFENTLTYIPGATIRGAFIGRFLKLNCWNNDEILNVIKNSNFFNSYPMYKYKCEDKYKDKDKCEDKDYYGLPTPNIFRIDKKDKKDKKYEKNECYSFLRDKSKNAIDNKRPLFTTIFDEVKTDKFYSDKNRITKFKNGDFCFEREKKLYTFNPKTIENFHHTHKKNRENIYRYNAIASSQNYYGILDLSCLEKDLKIDVLKSLSKIKSLVIGGARNSGYGRVSIKKLELFNKEEIFKKIGLESDNSKSNYTYFYSDYIGDLKPISLVEKENLSLTVGITSGFNAKWNARTPMHEYIEKGSVIKENVIEKLELFAEKKEEGFGFLSLNPSILFLDSINDISKYDKSVIKTKNLNVYLNGQVSVREIQKRVSNNYNKNYVEFTIKAYLFESMKDKYYNDFINKLKKDMGSNFNTIANSLILAIDESILKNDKEILNNWIDKKNQVTENREKLISNRQFLNFDFIQSYSIQELLNVFKEVKEVKYNESNKVYNTIIKLKNEKGEGLKLELVNCLKELNTLDIDLENVILLFVKQVLYYLTFALQTKKGGN